MDFMKFVDLMTASSSFEGAVLSKVMDIAPFPYYDIMQKKSFASVALAFNVTGGAAPHNVMLSYRVVDGESDFAVWCGDRFFEGKVDAEEATRRCTEAAISTSSAESSEESMFRAYGLSCTSGPCNHWTVWTKKKEVCKHCSAVLRHLEDTIGETKLIQSLETAYLDLVSGTVTEEVSNVGATLSLSELAFRVPVLFEGDRGSGKTMEARSFVKANGYAYVEVGGHEKVEATDLLGFLVPYQAGQFVWKDGPVSEAFRKAKTQKTVLVLDELLRIPQRELSILLTALSPDEGFYRIRTGRIVSVEDGVATEEVLECPASNLAVIATTNVGMEYAVDEADPALSERFEIIRKDTSAHVLRGILEVKAEARGFRPGIADACLTFYEKAEEARTRGLLRHAPTTRTLVRALELAATEKDIPRVLRTQMLHWVARTAEGRPVEEQSTLVERLMQVCFKPLLGSI